MSVLGSTVENTTIRQQCTKLSQFNDLIDDLMIEKIKNYYESWDYEIRAYHSGGKRVIVQMEKER